MDWVQNRENRERRGMRENRERRAVHSSYIWLGGLQGAAAVFAALLVGVLPQIIPELFNPDSLGQFVNGGRCVEQGCVGAVFAQGRRGGAAGRPIRSQVGGRRGALSGS